MKRSKFTEEQITYALRQAESVTPSRGCLSAASIAEQTFYAWKKRYAHLVVRKIRRLRRVEEENAQLKRLVTDLPFGKYILSEALRKKVYGPPAAGNWPSGFTGRFR